MIKAVGDGNVELYSNNVKRFQTRSGGGAADGIAVYGSSSNTAVNLFTDSSVRGSVYANSSNMVGFLDSGGDWAIRHTNDSQTEFFVQTNRKAAIDADGLKFGTDTATANALNDYEEGTWTPNIQGSGSNNSKTYSYQTGLYTKVGNKVTARFRIKWTSYTSDSGNAIVNGLPFTANDASVATGSFAGNNLNFPSSNHVTSALEVENGDTYMYILNTYDNAVWINSQASTFWQSTGEIRGEMTYFTNS